ncbi:MAG: hypothetical protein KDB22_18860 [Planctomycetales bacterium]|nr:hypothetical protein [Planctomycetales bacterium]
MATNVHEERLESYYALNVLHLRWSFWASLAALVVGLTALLFGIVLLYLGTPGIGVALVSVGGVVSEFIGAGFFVLYSRNLKQLNIFYEKLIKHQDTMYAIGLVSHLPESMRPDQYKTVIATLLTRNEPKQPMSPELAKVITDAMRDEKQKGRQGAGSG